MSQEQDQEPPEANWCSAVGYFEPCYCMSGLPCCTDFPHTLYNMDFWEVYGCILFLYGLVSNGKIVIKYIFSCVLPMTGVGSASA